MVSTARIRMHSLYNTHYTQGEPDGEPSASASERRHNNGKARDDDNEEYILMSVVSDIGPHSTATSFAAA